MDQNSKNSRTQIRLLGSALHSRDREGEGLASSKETGKLFWAPFVYALNVEYIGTYLQMPMFSSANVPD
jgi:hypothetical protein